MMKKQLFIHIGSPRTGTSSLQYFLFDNVEVLKKHGIVYPTGINLTMAKAHHPIYFGLSGDYWEPEFYFDITGKHLKSNSFKNSYNLYDTIEELKLCTPAANKIVLSSEGFFYLGKDHIQTLFEKLSEFDTKIIVYLRRQDEFISSIYKHYVKDSGARFTKSFSSFQAEEYVNNLNYHNKMMQWADVFGKENVNIKVYDRSILKNGDIIDDFLTIVDNDLKIPHKTKKSNQSLSQEEYFFFSLSNLLSWEKHKNAAEFNRFMLSSISTKKGSFELFTNESRIDFMEQFQNENILLNKDFGVSFPPLISSELKTGRPLQINLDDVNSLAKSLFNKSLTLFNNSSVSTEDTILISVNLWKAANNLLHKNVKMDSDSRLQLDQISSDLEWYINQKKENTSYIESLTNQIKSSNEINEKLNAENNTLSSKVTLQSDIIEKYKEFEKMSKKEIAKLKDQSLELIALLDQATSNPIKHKQPTQQYASDLSTQEQLDAVFNSISWKITAPFRWLSKAIFIPIHLIKALASGKNKTRNLKQVYNNLPNSIKHNRIILRIKDKYLAKNS